ncbi:MAG: hypothetical protein OXG47_08660 [bacterium]|nr:hypothetical protein [bacterium]
MRLTPRQARRRRRHVGLATLEWLIVVSVSALLAALVLAFVQRNLDHSVAQVAESSDADIGSARSLDKAQTLADELADRVQVQSLRYDQYDYRFQDPVYWAEHFSTRCRRIREVFADLEAEGVRVEVEADFRLDRVSLLHQRVRQQNLGEVPWIYGHPFQLSEPEIRIQRLTGQRLYDVPASTVCQVFLSRDPTYGLP